MKIICWKGFGGKFSSTMVNQADETYKRMQMKKCNPISKIKTKSKPSDLPIGPGQPLLGPVCKPLWPSISPFNSIGGRDSTRVWIDDAEPSGWKKGPDFSRHEVLCITLEYVILHISSLAIILILAAYIGSMRRLVSECSGQPFWEFRCNIHFAIA